MSIIDIGVVLSSALILCANLFYIIVFGGKVRKILIEFDKKQAALNDAASMFRQAQGGVLAGLPLETASLSGLDIGPLRSGPSFSSITGAQVLQGRLDDGCSQVVANVDDFQISASNETYAAMRREIDGDIQAFRIFVSERLQAHASALEEHVAKLCRYYALRRNVRESGHRKLKALLCWTGQDLPTLLVTQRREDLILIAIPRVPGLFDYIHGLSAHDVDRLIDNRDVKRIVLFQYGLGRAETPPVAFDIPDKIPQAIFGGLKRLIHSGNEIGKKSGELTQREYFSILAWARKYPGVIDFFAPYISKRLRTETSISDALSCVIPFDAPQKLPSALPAEPRKNSALFIHNSYYHYKYLSAALRDRGWDALSVALDSPASTVNQFFHGEDLSLYDPDPVAMREKTRTFFRSIPERFGAVHFYGRGICSLFPENWENSINPQAIPWDFLELRRHNVLIGFMPAGCNEGASQSSIRKLTNGICGRCVWENRPDVCSDAINLTWARKLSSICDVVTLEGDLAVDDRVGPMYVRRPIVTALDPELWKPDLAIPEEHLLSREKDELVVYHGVGLSKLRRNGDRDIKGTGAVMAAIERLRKEGAAVRLFFATDLQSRDVRYYQLQADLVVDQLNYGRLGANARETLMLGRPMVTCLRPEQGEPLSPLRPIEEVPALHATEETIYEVLKEILLDPERRAALGKAGRDFALKWHAAPVCALRYERMINRLRAGLAPEADEVFS
ncbi:glycosyltransferase [Microvirga alba]|uniref:Glycosyltransferase family 1 protein n=1 Tax=Microvirga alba TaxID=2791025 RepID=A0A931BSD8_9HYPH|nr:glycosyltransferase [Microvirga alba]MBF9231977.1 glycosyltransferase family 1 protein [Microvirga alba]